MITAWWLNTSSALVRRRVLVMLQNGSDPPGDVGPALAAGGAGVELAEPRPAFGLLGEPGLDPVPGEAVEQAEVAFAQPFVALHGSPNPPSGG